MNRSFVFRELTELIGETAAHALCKEYGGTNLFVPKSMSRDHKLAKLLGLSSAKALSELHGGIEIELPLGPPGACTKRTQIARMLEETTLTHAAIARDIGTTERWVREVARSVREEQQPRLF